MIKIIIIIIIIIMIIITIIISIIILLITILIIIKKMMIKRYLQYHAISGADAEDGTQLCPPLVSNHEGLSTSCHSGLYLVTTDLIILPKQQLPRSSDGFALSRVVSRDNLMGGIILGEVNSFQYSLYWYCACTRTIPISWCNCWLATGSYNSVQAV